MNLKAFHSEPSLEQMRVLGSEAVAPAQMSEPLGRVCEMLATFVTRLLENAATGRSEQLNSIFRSG